MKRKNKTLTSADRKARRKRRWKRTGIALLITVAVLIVIRLIIPPIVVAVVNKKMSHMPDYLCRIEDIDLSLITGTVYVKKISMTKKNSDIEIPFFTSDKLKLSLEMDKFWKTGRLVGNIEVPDFTVNLVQGPTPETTQLTVDPGWIELIDELLPIGINTLTVEDGTVNYSDHKINKKPALVVDSIQVEGSNLVNAEEKDTLLPSTVLFNADCIGGDLQVAARLNLQYEIPYADVNAKLNHLPIARLNPLLLTYAKFDVQKGRFDLYTEFAIKDGKVKGYSKPLIRGLEIQDPEAEKNDSGIRKLRESLVEIGIWALKNKPEDQLATRVEIKGDLTKPDVSIWQIIGSTLYNAFIEALMPGLDYSINIKSLGGKNKNRKKDKPQKRKK